MAQIEEIGGKWGLYGIGFAEIPMSFFGWGKFGGGYCSVIFHGNLRLRVLRENRDVRPLSVYAARDTWLWPFWWLACRIITLRKVSEETNR